MKYLTYVFFYRIKKIDIINSLSLYLLYVVFYFFANLFILEIIIRNDFNVYFSQFFIIVFLSMFSFIVVKKIFK